MIVAALLQRGEDTGDAAYGAWRGALRLVATPSDGIAELRGVTGGAARKPARSAAQEIRTAAHHGAGSASRAVAEQRITGRRVAAGCQGLPTGLVVSAAAEQSAVAGERPERAGRCRDPFLPPERPP